MWLHVMCMCVCVCVGGEGQSKRRRGYSETKRWVWWHVPVISALRMLRQEDHGIQGSLGYKSNIQACLDYTVSPCLRKLGCGWCLSQYYSSYLKGDALQDKGQVARNAPGRNLMH